MSKLELKIPPPVIMIVTAALMWWTASSLPSLAFAFPGRRAAAIVVGLAGATVALLGMISFRRADTTINPLNPAKTSALVVTGIFRVTRNPMYAGLLLVLTAWALQLSNFVVLAFPVLFVLYMNRFQILPEERFLAAKFGSDFAAYCQRVRRW